MSNEMYTKIDNHFFNMTAFMFASILIAQIGTVHSSYGADIFSNSGIQSDSTKSPDNWFNLDPSEDNVQGLSTDKAYKTLLKDKPSRTIIVAVIDSGVDIDHEDLKDKIWENEKEIPNNGKDDDKNGYIDDIHGWNFIGGKDGTNVVNDTHEMTREYVRLKSEYGDLPSNKVKKKQKEEYEYWLKVQKNFERTFTEASQQYSFYKNLHDNVVRYSTLLKAYLDTEKLTTEALNDIKTEDETINIARGIINLVLNNVGEDVDFKQVADDLEQAVDHFGNQVNFAYNTNFNPRKIVGDNYGNLNEKGYGNNDVMGPDASHGTHVAGIIAANRSNEIGIKGIAENVKIMPIRAVPNGDERDKDIANAILYAVDNGAHIINMSFGKSYSPHKMVVDKAVKYAEEKGVLMVHAAGNSSENIDNKDNFPNRVYNESKSEAKNWLEIGASSWGKDENFIGSFSNYGKKSVDFFSPGVEVYSTTPDNKYESFNGTSMAAPATSGVAAILMSYFPRLSALEVKEILKKSTRKFDNLKVKKPGTEKKVEVSDLSITGGLINAYEAIKMAQSLNIKNGLN